MEQMIHKSFAKLTAWEGSKPPLCFRRKLFYLQKELLKERTRNTTLEEQLKPVNIHRWRLLEVTQLVQLSKLFFFLDHTEDCLLLKNTENLWLPEVTLQHTQLKT